MILELVKRKKLLFAIEYFNQPVISVVSLLFFIKYLSDIFYGEWAIFIATQAFCCGLVNGIANIFVSSSNNNQFDKKEFVRHLRKSICYSLILLGVVWIVIFHFKYKEITLLFAFYSIVAVVLEAAEILINSCLRMQENQSKMVLIDLLFRNIGLVVFLIIGYLTKQINMVIAFYLLSQIIRLFMKSRLIQFSKKQDCTFKNCSFIHTLLDSLGGMMSNSLDKIIVGLLFGPTALANYNASIQIPSIIHGLVSAINKNQLTNRSLTINIKTDLLLLMPLFALSFSCYYIYKYIGMSLTLSDYMLSMSSYFLLSLNVQFYYKNIRNGKMKEISKITFIAGLLSVIYLLLNAVEIIDSSLMFSKIIFSFSTLLIVLIK